VFYTDSYIDSKYYSRHGRNITGFNDAGKFIPTEVASHHSVHSSDEDETKENSTPTASSVKLSQSSALRHRAAEGLDLMVGIMECQRVVQERLLEEHIQVNENNHLAHEAHERTMSALREGLLQ